MCMRMCVTQEWVILSVGQLIRKLDRQPDSKSDGQLQSQLVRQTSLQPVLSDYNDNVKDCG